MEIPCSLDCRQILGFKLGLFGRQLQVDKQKKNIAVYKSSPYLPPKTPKLEERT